MPDRLGGRARLLPTRRRPADGPSSDARRIAQLNAPKISIRPAGSNDRDAIATLYLQLKRHHADLVPEAARYQVDDDRWAGMALHSFDRGEHDFFVAEEEGAPVGFVRVFYEEKSFGIACEVETLVVDDAHRGKGIGEALMAHVEAVARAAGARAVRVNVLHVNERGRTFYEGLEYGLVAVRYGKDL